MNRRPYWRTVTAQQKNAHRDREKLEAEIASRIRSTRFKVAKNDGTIIKLVAEHCFDEEMVEIIPEATRRKIAKAELRKKFAGEVPLFWNCLRCNTYDFEKWEAELWVVDPNIMR